MRSPTANRRRSLRNRQNHRTSNRNRHPIRHERKVEYENSTTNEDGVLILSTRNRPLATQEELAERKRKKLQVQSNKVKQISLRHKLVNFYNYGAFSDNLQFPAKDNKSIISFLQQEYPIKYVKRKMQPHFFYRTIVPKQEGKRSNRKSRLRSTSGPT